MHRGVLTSRPVRRSRSCCSTKSGDRLYTGHGPESVRYRPLRPPAAGAATRASSSCVTGKNLPEMIAIQQIM